jgi:hypothetical protein
MTSGHAHSQSAPIIDSSRPLLIHAGMSIVGGLASGMIQGIGPSTEAFNGSAARHVPVVSLSSLESGKSQAKRPAAGASSAAPPKKAPRLEIPEQGLHPGIEVFSQSFETARTYFQWRSVTPHLLARAYQPLLARTPPPNRFVTRAVIAVDGPAIHTSPHGFQPSRTPSLGAQLLTGDNSPDTLAAALSADHEAPSPSTAIQVDLSAHHEAPSPSTAVQVNRSCRVCLAWLGRRRLACRVESLPTKHTPRSSLVVH